MSGTAFSHFDLDHWLRVKAERARLGITRRVETDLELPNHPLVGQTLVDQTTGRTYRVERVKKDWFHGWFLTALLNNDGSHRMCVVETMSCTEPAVLRQLAGYQESFAPRH